MESPWDKTEFFRHDDISYPHQTNAKLPPVADSLRRRTGCPMWIHRCHDPMASPGSRHRKPVCDALDFHLVGISLLDAFLAISQDTKIRAIGVYPDWLHPGFHIDLRQRTIRGHWMRLGSDRYVELSESNIINNILKGLEE